MLRALVIAGLCCVSPGRAAADCPATGYDFSQGTFYDSSPSGSAYYTDGTTSEALVRWDAIVGTVSVRCGAIYDGSAGGTVFTADQFSLGTSGADPLRLTVRFVATGYPDWFGGVLRDATGRIAGLVRQEPLGELTQKFYEFAVDFTPGTPLFLQYELNAVAFDGYVDAVGQISFPDLPAGMSIVSCRGFRAGAVTSTRSVSWGRIKQIYR